MTTWAKNAITYGLPAVCFVGGSLVSSFRTLSAVATVSDVREVRTDAFNYTDKQIAIAAAELKSYSDANRSKTLLEIKDEIKNISTGQADTRARVEEILRRLPRGER